MEGFYKSKSQPELMAPYWEKYFAILPEIIETRDREFAQSFCNYLTPATLARDEDEAAFKALLQKATDQTHFFTLFLKQQVEIIDIIKKGRALCETYKAS